jgi:phosphoglycolate phosphatase-like HAD superfamily hydrolase
VGTDRPRVFLFDIDGTLLHGGGLSVESYCSAFTHIFGEPYSIRAVDCSGRTDPWIVRAVLRHYGLTEFAEDGSILEEIFRHFLTAMRAMVDAGYQAEVLPGVREALDFLGSTPGVTRALLTGNLKEGARLKLQAAELLQYFGEESFALGAFGSDHHERERLAAIALDRLRHALGDSLQARDVWIVGDSIHDISCARAAGFRVLAVASGSTPRAELADKNPDILIDALDVGIFRRILHM